MGYMHIDNLYKVPDIFLFREVYALEKIHGTSAHVSWNVERGVSFFAGGGKHESFVALFGASALAEAFLALGHAEVTVFGESYGGKCQGMKETYGEQARFIAFDVRVGETWLAVPNAADVVAKIGLEFVHFEKVPATVEALNAARDAPSVQAVRNGITEPREREGIVVRPPVEFFRSNGSRVIAKHKGEKFVETRTPREVDPAALAVLVDAEAVAFEWVTDARMAHVVDKLRAAGVDVEDMRSCGDVVREMIADVKREGEGEIAWSRDVEKAIGKASAKMFKGRLARGGS